MLPSVQMDCPPDTKDQQDPPGPASYNCVTRTAWTWKLQATEGPVRELVI